MSRGRGILPSYLALCLCNFCSQQFSPHDSSGIGWLLLQPTPTFGVATPMSAMSYKSTVSFRFFSVVMSTDRFNLCFGLAGFDQVAPRLGATSFGSDACKTGSDSWNGRFGTSMPYRIFSRPSEVECFWQYLALAEVRFLYGLGETVGFWDSG